MKTYNLTDLFAPYLIGGEKSSGNSPFACIGVEVDDVTSEDYTSMLDIVSKLAADALAKSIKEQKHDDEEWDEDFDDFDVDYDETEVEEEVSAELEFDDEDGEWLDAEEDWIVGEIYLPKAIYRNGKTTTVMWVDGEKTIVNLKEGCEDSPYTAFVYAVAKRMFGSMKKISRLVEERHLDLIRQRREQEKQKRIQEQQKREEENRRKRSEEF